MAAPLDLRFQVRATSDALDDPSTGSVGIVAGNPRGDILGAQALPTYTEQSRLLRTWEVIEKTPSIPGVSLPTTLAGVTLWNGESDGGKLYFIQRIFAFITTSVAAESPVGLCHLINVGKKAAPPTASLSIRGLAGQVYRGNAIVGVGATVTDDEWEPIGTSVIAPASQIGVGVEAIIDGFYIVPPGYMYSMFVLVNSGAVALVRGGIRWAEVQLPIRG